MTFPPARDLDAVAAALTTLRSLEAEEGVAAGRDPATAGAVGAESAAHVAATAGADRGRSEDATLSEAQLLVRSLAALGAVRAAVEAVALRRIASLERACELDPETSPIRSSGYRDLESLLAELWRTSLPAARQLCSVARAVAPRHSLHGEELPAEFPELAAALLGTDGDNAGSRDDSRTVDEAGGEDAALLTRVSVEQAAVIIRELGKTGPGCSLEQRTYGERVLVDHAPGLTVEETRRLAVQVRDRLDQDGIEPREEVQRRRRSLTITTTRDGMTHIDWYLDAVSAGHVLPQIRAYVSRDLHDTRAQRPSSTGASSRVRFESRSGGPDTPSDGDPERPENPEMPETRGIAQLNSDGAVEVFRHRAGCTHGASSPPVTMIIRMTLADLRAGEGTAEIDGIPSPISTGTARRLAADAHLIPHVLGGHSETLDLGRKQRLFSPAQKHALAERDGGCAWTGCPHPPSYTQAHHIRWWDRDTGPTDLKNGILLCSHHHHRVHDDGWGIAVRDNVPWFTPPAHYDPTRTPRPGGRLRIPESAPP